MREIEDAILLLQDKVDSLQSTNTQLEARVSALETEVQNQLELIQSLQQDG
jgi:prefoldin subunit 5